MDNTILICDIHLEQNQVSCESTAENHVLISS